MQVNPPAVDKPRYRNRKDEISTNVLGVCTRDLKFAYVLSGWEGSATDSRILQNALQRPNGLKVPQGQFYSPLAMTGYIPPWLSSLVIVVSSNDLQEIIILWMLVTKMGRVF